MPVKNDKMKEEIDRILRRNFSRGDVFAATNELMDLFNNSYLSANNEEEEEKSCCDVEGCEGETENGGGCWRETGYWTVCSDHSKMHRDGNPQPKMKQSAIDREKSRDPKTGCITISND